jgi:hypothetical protein
VGKAKRAHPSDGDRKDGGHGEERLCPAYDSIARMSEAACGTAEKIPDVVEPVIGRAFARPVGLSGYDHKRPAPIGIAPILLNDH